MKARLLYAAAAMAIVLAAMQLFPAPAVMAGRHGATHGDVQTIEASLTMPMEVKTILGKACSNCHSSETAWPWYARVAPASWLMAHDVTRARAAMNFSEWPSGYRASGLLMAACAAGQGGQMPPRQDTMMHPEARLSAAEVRSLCGWTVASLRQLRAGRALKTAATQAQ
jgi:hypothetical protein